MGLCSSKYNNIKMNILNHELSDELDISSEIVQELSHNKNLLNELLPINPVNELLENDSVNKLLENNPVNELLQDFNELKEDVINTIKSYDNIKDEKQLEEIKKTQKKEKQKIKQYKKELKNMYKKQNKYIEKTKNEINNIFNEKIEKINVLIENYNLRLNEIETICLSLQEQNIITPEQKLSFLI